VHVSVQTAPFVFIVCVSRTKSQQFLALISSTEMDQKLASLLSGCGAWCAGRAGYVRQAAYFVIGMDIVHAAIGVALLVTYEGDHDLVYWLAVVLTGLSAFGAVWNWAYHFGPASWEAPLTRNSAYVSWVILWACIIVAFIVVVGWTAGPTGAGATRLVIFVGLTTLQYSIKPAGFNALARKMEADKISPAEVADAVV